jgi:uncharacterized membrane protein
MFGRNGSSVTDRAVEAGAMASDLAQDKKFRDTLLAAMGHATAAQQRARRLRTFATVARMAGDAQLRAELRKAATDLQAAWSRADSKRGHRLRNTMLVVTGGGAVAALAIPQSRKWVLARVGLGGKQTPRVVDAELEVDVPVSQAYNQWTQFEEFPQFMEGVEEVRQLDDTRLHWVASIGGKRAEWDAKILEQHPDQQVSWVSEDGKLTRGTVSFEPRGAERTLLRLSMSYRPEGVRESVGSAAGVDKRRVQGDLQRFKELIESRATATGAWRGDISEGSTS